MKKKFIVPENLEQQAIESNIAAISNFCQVDAASHVVFKDVIKKLDLTVQQKLLLTLAARFLGRELQSLLKENLTIVTEANADELAKITGDKKEVIQARIKELKDAQKVTAEAGIYRITPHGIGNIMMFLQSKVKDG